MTKKSKSIHDRLFLIAFLAFVMITYMVWSYTQQLNFSADETMRFQVVQYIYDHGTLPHGGDPEIRDANWGISYAFNPILSYIGSAILMRIMAIFTTDPHMLLVAARFMNVIWGTGTAWFVWLLAKRLFKKEDRIMFTALITFLPGAVILYSYVNTDALAMFSSAFIVYMWVRSLQDGWTYKNCALLGVGISFCALSYYNAYGYALCSILLFCADNLLFGEKKWDFATLIRRGLVVTAVVALLAGWWFLRNAIIYDGDFMGRATSHAYAVQYAQKEYNPVYRTTMQEAGNISLFSMLFYRPPYLGQNWLMTVIFGLIGCFGYNQIYLTDFIYYPYMVFICVGLAALVLWKRDLFYFRKHKVMAEQDQKTTDEEEVLYVMYRTKGINRKAVFHAVMILAIIIPNFLNAYYSFSSDFQPQGRYSMPMLIPFMYFVTMGYNSIAERFIKNEKVRKGCYYLVAAGAAGMMLFSWGRIIYPMYLQNYSGLH